MLRHDEILDQNSYKHKILAQNFASKADQYRFTAYSTRSKVNGLFAKALKLKEKAYHIESKLDDQKDPKWMEVFRLKSNAFALETRANLLNVQVYDEKRIFYVYSKKEAEHYAKFTELKSKAYAKKVAIKAPGECTTKKKNDQSD